MKSCSTADRRAWILWGVQSDYLIAPWSEITPADYEQQVPAVFASAQIKELLASSPIALREILDLLGRSPPVGFNVSERSSYDRETERRFAEAFRSGELVMLRMEHPAVSMHVSASKPIPPPPLELLPEPSFVAIELVDDNGKPMAGTRYCIVLPDGGKREGCLNSNGYARVDGIDPGSCKITFPDLDKNSWRPGQQ
jgi:hypothetical protein